MEELINKNNQLYKEVVETFQNIQQSIDDTTKNYRCYIGSIKNEVFELKDNETYEQAIKRGEGIFDRMDETERRRKIVIEKSQQTINKIEIKLVREKMEIIIQECKSDEATLSKTRNELIDKIISIEEMIMKNKILKRPEETDKITEEFNKKKEEWFTYYSDYFERKKREEEEKERKKQEEEQERKRLQKINQEKEERFKKIQNEIEKKQERKKQERERLRIMKGMNTMEEMIQLEKWTNRKVGNRLFDSDNDGWYGNTSVFDQILMSKEHIIIIIEDEEGNKFGGYVNSKIDRVNDWIYDSKSFVFSLESNGRIEGMMKFDIKEPEYAFYLYNQSYNCLFKIGNCDIVVYKENYKRKSYCYQYSFSYEGISNALCGKFHPEHFIPKRFIVIEMK